MFIPSVKHIPSWFPGAGFHRHAKSWRESAIAMEELPFADYMHRVVCFPWV